MISGYLVHDSLMTASQSSFHCMYHSLSCREKAQFNFILVPNYDNALHKEGGIPQFFNEPGKHQVRRRNERQKGEKKRAGSGWEGLTL